MKRYQGLRRARLTKGGSGRYTAENGRFSILSVGNGVWKVVDHQRDNSTVGICEGLDTVRVRIASVVDREKRST